MTDKADYWSDLVRSRVLAAIGMHERGEEARRRMQPDSPDLVADQFHPSGGSRANVAGG